MIPFFDIFGSPPCSSLVYLHKSKSFILYFNSLKEAVSRYSVIFCTFLREQKVAAARANVVDISSRSVSRANSFTAQAVSSKCHFCRFPRPSLVAAIIFPHTKWLPKITDYRDTAALKTKQTKSRIKKSYTAQQRTSVDHTIFSI